MALFDSATVAMKKKRNQKKDGSVLDQMRRSSADVEALEYEFEGDWHLRRARDIFGPLSAENSPVKPEEPTPKRRKSRRQPPPLMEIHGNIQTHNRGRRSNLNGCEIPQKASIYNHDYRDQRYEPTTDEDVEFRLAVEDLNKKKQFNIFRDTENSPGRTESPMEEENGSVL
jgi:hypothetical protein